MAVRTVFVLFLLVLSACNAPAAEAPAGAARKTAAKAWEVHFSPKGGCTTAVVAHIAAAKHSIHVQAYSFTSQPVADALAAAKKRGVNVQVILDSDDVGDHGSQYTKLATLQEAGIPVFSDGKHPIAHNKVMVFDGTMLETGSFNYTAQAENGNAENCLFLDDKELAVLYESNWQAHLTHSPPVP